MPRRERPLDAGDGTLLRFAAGLRTLRNKAGDPTYRELARRAHYSAGTLSDAASGRKLPTLAVTLAYVRACAGDTDEWEQRWHEVATEEADQNGEVSLEDAGQAPYVGLRFFRTEDSSRFFGRDQLTTNLVTRLTQRRFLAVFGPSGAGKSSLLRAGLVPRLSDDASAHTVLFVPGPHPVEECAVHLARLAGTTAGQLYPELVADPRNLHRVVRQALADSHDDSELVLVVDQFEEVFTLCRDADERAAFITGLLTAATAENSRTRVVLGIRADFYPHCADYPELAAALSDAQVLVGPMAATELRDAIVRPAVHAGDTVEGALVAELIAEAQGQAGVLPLLSHVLLETWRSRRGNALTLTGYHAVGRIQGALARTAEHHYAAFTPEQQRRVKQLFLRLTALGEGTDDTKRRVPRTELDLGDPDTETVLATLAAARLITLDDGSVEIAHESLIKAWPRLRGWLTEDRDGLRTHRQLTEATATWESLHQDPGALYRGTRLTVAADWAHHNDHALTPRERDFLHTSITTNRRERATTLRRNRQLRWLAVGLALALVATGALAVTAMLQQRATAEQRQIALSRQFAAQASSVARQDTSQAIHWSLNAFGHHPTVEARSILLSMAGRPADHGSFRLPHNSAAVSRSTLSADGQLLAVPEAHSISLYDVPTRDEIAVLRQPDGANTDSRSFSVVAFSPDRTRLVTGSLDGHVEVWDVTRRIRIAEFPGQGTRAHVVAFSPDGMRVAVIDFHQGMQLWDVGSGQLLLSAPGSEYQMEDGFASAALAFSPDGRTLATTSELDLVVLWDLTTMKKRVSLRSMPGRERTLVFWGDGTKLVIPDGGGNLETWDIATNRLVDVYSNAGTVYRMEFDDKSGAIVLSSYDGGLKIWFPNGNVVDIPGGEGVESFQLADDGTIVSPAARGLRIWKLNRILCLDRPELTDIAFDVSGRKMLGIGSATTSGLVPLKSWEFADLAVYSTPFSAEETTYPMRGLASPNRKLSTFTVGRRRIALYDLVESKRVAELTAPSGELDALAFSSDSRLLAASYGPENNEPGYTLIWDLAKQQPVAKLPITATVLAFSPNGRHLAVSDSTTVSIWDLSTQTRLDDLPATRARVTDLAYSPDGQLLAAGTNDGTVALWNTTRYDHVEDLRGHSGSVNTLAFSPDGTSLATAGADTNIVIWDMSVRVPWATLVGHTNSIEIATWNADGTTLATASSDGTITTWPTNTDMATQQLCRNLATDFPQDAEPQPPTCTS